MNPDGSKMSKRDKAKAARTAAKAQALSSVGFDDERFAAFLDKKNDDIDLALAVAKSLGLALPEIEVADFRRSGYLPDALLNYLALLGWNPGNNVERFDLDFLKQNFSLERIGKSNAKFDRDKLFRFNADSIAQLAPEDFARRLRDHFESQHPAFVRKLDSQAFATFAECYRPRARTLSEPAELGRFFITDDSAIVFDAKAVDKVLAKGDGYAVLAALKPALEACDWNSHAIEAAVKQFAEGRQLGLGKVAQPLRVAVTGNTVSPSIGDTLALLGKASTMARIDRCLQLQPA
jgi:glutamyl-tRNA synthetase